MTQYQAHLDWIAEQQQGMLNTLLSWSEINSGSFNLEGLGHMCAALESTFETLGGERETLNLSPLKQIDAKGQLAEVALGKAIRVRKRSDAAIQVFLGGHYDTVFAEHHAFQTNRWLDAAGEPCARETAAHLNGPGVADMKGGLLVMLTAIQALERSPWASNLGWEILLNPDEEIGSPGSAELLTQAANRNHLGLVYEPSMPDGSLAGARKGSGNFTAVVSGKAAHAGREHHLGRNAIAALAGFITELDQLNGKNPGTTINVGKIEGGGATNIVPDLAICRLNVRVENQAGQDWFVAQLKTAEKRVAALDGISIKINGGFGRPPKSLNNSNQLLFEQMRRCGEDLKINLTWQATGGCCDGNNLAAAGLPNIDTLGVRGGAIHSADEYMYPESLTERAQLSALFLMKLAAGDLCLQEDFNL